MSVHQTLFVMATVAISSVLIWQHGKKPTLNVKIGIVNWQGWKKVGKIETLEAISINQRWVRATIFKYINIYCCFEVPVTFLLLLLLLLL